ncbi:hypothetical protein N7510_011742 [Penicillium lagena]|uniref:uncharacterized protein n=1 Tax=Penicillium lagena TaxID=94218 RepID=UPI00254158EE|nr:uncharacterized protein N7510_011742 [Penicillium lagena]KAJ5602208.1 hypothetical protein N7510_011742 [Penicillium lagena]
MRYNALIRTHHITSRKKVAALKRAADAHKCSVLLRYGGCPGIMYVEGDGRDGVNAWLSEVRKLKYKDFQLVARPELLVLENDFKGSSNASSGSDDLALGVSEVDSVKEFGNRMAERGVWKWWRSGMGYT